MPNPDLTTYKTLYLQTAREHLRDLKKDLTLLNQTPQDQHLVYEIFRLFHSLKSQNYFMGFQNTGNFCKTLETYFRKIKDGFTAYHPAVSNIIIESIVQIENSLNMIEKNGLEKDLHFEISSFEKRLGLQ
ncbi:hypothetical protein A2774_01800 [Candidatus Roizmanbacteria bacterium RIFCSPHIGHO2_01_FULL_39_12c]|uniref:HPt domain-containing protein n=1 Tax=Candidatus Roizmanbacteria bacterium RIFCSPHIGHO2_01_FULL_39_12c TaxID=1802031 RepID=A0A1F7GBD4_9BACT|nr:MAG: hypothetical protein A2774_01800 [Candidatus Roizmanbacteria bacterium RIFCSPHIGHO2_01_FULL_39_12c]OGK46926.1 MAG: hypothetical protein A2963_05210 [Candidatus Roizmanbacteria bacterium RIFCSPLOWO2_01_FULL_40_13]